MLEATESAKRLALNQFAAERLRETARLLAHFGLPESRGWPRFSREQPFYGCVAISDRVKRLIGLRRRSRACARAPSLAAY